MNIYSYSETDNKNNHLLKKYLKNNIFSVFTINKKKKILNIIKTHPESVLSEYEVNISNSMKNLTLLQYCCYYSNEKIVKALLENNYFEIKERIIKERFFYQEEIEESLYIDQEEVLPDNIDNNLEENRKNEIQKSIYYSLIAGNKKVFLLLLKNGGAINEPVTNDWSENNNYLTPLSVAIALEDFKLANEILKLGGDINNIGCSLHYAIQYLKINQVRYIVEKGGDINLKDYTGKPPLFYLVFSSKIYKEKLSTNVYKIIDLLESKGSKIYWGDKLVVSETNIKFNLLNGLISSGNIKDELIRYLLNKGAFLDPNNISLRSSTPKMIQSLYNSGLLKNIEEYGLNIIDTDLAFYVIKNSFYGIKKIQTKKVLETLKSVNPNVDLYKEYNVSEYNIKYPVNILFYIVLLREYETFSYLLDIEHEPYVPKKISIEVRTEIDYLLYLLLIESYRYKKENIDINKEEDFMNILKKLVDLKADVLFKIKEDYPLIFNYIDCNIKQENELDKIKNKSEMLREKKKIFRKKIFDVLLSSPVLDKREMVFYSVVFYFKLLYQCSLEEKLLKNNHSLHKNNEKFKSESFEILEKFFTLYGISENNEERNNFYKNGLVFLKNKTEVYEFLLNSEIIKNIFLEEKEKLLSKVESDGKETKRRRL